MQSDNAGVIAPPPLLYAGALIALFLVRWQWPASILADRTPLFYGGIALGIAGLAIGLWGRWAMVSARTNINPYKPTLSIVSAGPFGFSRNPLYVGMAMLYLGISLAFDTWWGIVLLPPVLVVMHFGVIRREEEYLERKFGDEYRRYKSAVARYVG